MKFLTLARLRNGCWKFGIMGVENMAELTNSDFKLFQNYINEKCGINISEEKAYLIETRLSKLLIDSGFNSYEELYVSLMSRSDPHIMMKVIDAITTNETLWFRDKTPWEIMENVLMPNYISDLRSYRKSRIRIWSAASSTGQEAYSTAMFIDYYLEKNKIKDISLSHFEIIATDISASVLDIAKKGRYDSISIMRGLDQIYKDRYFIKTGLVWELDNRIKKAVKFEQFNLQNSFMFLGQFDLIFCRYVLIYFADKLKQDIFQKISSNLLKNGALIIGASELYYLMEDLFVMKNEVRGTYYKRRCDSLENVIGG